MILAGPSPGVVCDDPGTKADDCQIQNTLKILIVTAMYPRPEDEGSGAFVMHQVEELRTLGHDVDVLHFRGDNSASISQSRSRGILLNAPPALFRGACSLRFGRIASSFPERNPPRNFAPRQRCARRVAPAAA